MIEIILRKLEKAVAVRNSLLGEFSGKFSTLLENSSPIFRQRGMLSLPKFGHFPARKMAAGKLAPPSGTLLDFLLRDRHSLLKFLGCCKWGCNKWGLKRCLAALPGNRPKSVFLRPFSALVAFCGGSEEHLKNPKKEEKGLFPQISLDFLKPPSLKPPFAELQSFFLKAPSRPY